MAYPISSKLQLYSTSSFHNDTRSSYPWRILYVCVSRQVGGAEILAAELARAFPKDRVRYEIGCTDPSQRILRFFLKQGIKAFSLPGAVTPMAQAVKRGSFHLVESNSLGAEIAEASSRAGMPFIWKIVVAPDQFTSWPRQLPEIKKILKWSSRVVILSHRLISQLNGIEPTRLHVIPAGVDPARFTRKILREKRRHFRKKFGLNPDTPAIGMVAHFHRRKRHLDFVLSAFKVLEEIPDARFFLFGDPYPGLPVTHRYRRSIGRFIRRLGLRDSVSLHPAYPDRVALAAGLDVVVLPSIGEGIPLTLLDAMAAGTPVIGTKSGGTPDLIEHGRTGYLVQPQKPMELAKFTLDLLKNPERRCSLGETGQAKAFREFDIRETALKHETLYAELLQG